MELGVSIRNMGEQSTAEVIGRCLGAAEAAGLESAWIVDHIAIPPDDAEGSGGRYVDPLVTLAWMAGVSKRIRIGSAVLILPYRPALPTAKQIASIQELSGGRLLLGVGIGWMDAEFRALGVDRHRRGRIADETLETIHRCFADDEVELNGQPFLFKPRPPRPPIYVGGGPPHALHRAARFGDGWMPMGADPAKLGPRVSAYHEICREAGRPPGEVCVMGGLPLADAPAARDRLDALAEIGTTRFVCAMRYATADDYLHQLDRVAALL